MRVSTPLGARVGRRIVLPALVYVQLLALVRNTLLARLLGPEQFGVAVTFLLAQQFIEMSTDTGLNKFVLQNQFGNRASIQATVQWMAALRGTVIASLIIGVAWPTFMLLGWERSLWPFAILATASLAMGFLHYDNARQQRNNIFLNDSISSIIGETFGLIACLLSLWMSHSYLSVLIGIMSRSVFLTISSHILSRRRYVIRYSKAWKDSILGYSWPLLINGPLLFFSTQFDRIFVNAVLGLRELGIYSATLLLLVLPLGLLTRLLGSIFVPRLARAFHAGKIAEVELEFTGVVLTVAILSACGFTAVGPTALVMLYGPAYAQAVLPICLIGLAQAIRFLRTWPSSLAVAVGQTSNLLLSTIVRLLALPFGLAGILLGDGITGLAAGLLAGEVLALIVSMIMLNRGRRLRLVHGLREVAVMVGTATALPVLIGIFNANATEACIIAAMCAGSAFLLIYRINRHLIPRNLAAFGW